MYSKKRGQKVYQYLWTGEHHFYICLVKLSVWETYREIWPSNNGDFGQCVDAEMSPKMISDALCFCTKVYSK